MPNPQGKTDSPAVPCVVSAGEIYDKGEVCRRLRWARHSWRQARRAGLRTVRFGARDFVLGAWIIEFFAALADRQGDNGEAVAGQGKET